MFPIPWNFPFRKKDGSLSTIGAEMGGTIPPATADKIGGIKVGSGLSVTSDGTLSGTNELPAYTIATAGKVLTVGDDGSLEWDESGAGGGDAFITRDFTKMGTRTINYVNFSSDGATFDGADDYIELFALGASLTDITIYIDCGTMDVKTQSNQHRRFIMKSSSDGLIYRYSGVWAFYNSAWYDTEITDKDFFSNSTVKIYVDENSMWHVYKDGVLACESPSGMTINSLYLGSSGGQCLYDAFYKGCRVYNGNYTE